MNKKHKQTLDAIFSSPAPASIKWRDVESLLRKLGAEIEERDGSRLCVKLHGKKAIFHEPHPRKETDKGAVVALRCFLQNAGVKP